MVGLIVVCIPPLLLVVAMGPELLFKMSEISFATALFILLLIHLNCDTN